MMTTESSGTASKVRRRSRFKRIVITERNYLALKKLGYAGDSFNDVISKLLRIERSYQEMKKQQQKEQQQENSDDSNELRSLLPISATFEKENKQQIDRIVQLLRGKRRGKCSMNNETSE